jgi:hypothetical protein
VSAQQHLCPISVQQAEQRSIFLENLFSSSLMLAIL